MWETVTKKIFQSIFLVSFLVLIACLSLVVGMLYNHYGNIQKTTLETELTLTAAAMEKAGSTYLYNLSNLKSISEKNIRFTHIAADGRVLFDTQTQASAMETMRIGKRFNPRGRPEMAKVRAIRPLCWKKPSITRACSATVRYCVFPPTG